MLLWFQSYLENRVLRVVVQGYKYFSYTAYSGVPQGSHLGPILFLFFINDITKYRQYSKCSLFADYLKIYEQITCPDDSRMLLNNLHSIHKRWINNNMILNASNCFHVKFTKKKNDFYPRIALDIWVDSKLKLVEHIEFKACQLIRFVKRTCNSFRKISAIISLYNSLIRSSLKYSPSVIHPFYKGHIDCV